MPRLAALLVVLLVSGCTPQQAEPAAEPSATRSSSPLSSRPTTSAAPTPTPTPMPTPTPSASPTRSPESRFDTWVVGAEPLPRRPDGYGQVLPTPRQLRVRRMRTVDVLPPPADGRYHATIGPVTPRFVRRTDLAWSPRCPVALRDLRYLRLSFWGFDDRPHTGELVVAASVATDVTGVFRKLYDARFPIESMGLITQKDLDAAPTGDGNGTGAYACRPTVGATSWSSHAYGLAIDVNPFNNPYTKGDLVVPELSSSYLDRSWRRPGMIFPGGVVVRAFADVGWTWGGNYRTLKDRHHFSANGR